LLIDIAMPRDIAPDAEENPFVTLKNIDDLNKGYRPQPPQTIAGIAAG
jgi:glutamyl-tRNA reductase